jgi:hypothetical protein
MWGRSKKIPQQFTPAFGFGNEPNLFLRRLKGMLPGDCDHVIALRTDEMPGLVERDGRGVIKL